MARIHHARFALVAMAALGASCAPEFEEKLSELKTLRVLAVNKDSPYVNPDTGDTVNLSILWRDGSGKPPRPVQITWFTGCENPPGDLFFGCIAPTPLFSAGKVEVCSPTGPAAQPSFTGCDNKVSVNISSTITDRPPSTDPTQPPYGLSYAFFAVCAGELKQLPPEQLQQFDFPYGCFDQENNRLGPDDFVAGYTSIYAYRDPEIANSNPPVSGIIFKDVPATEFCIGDKCLNVPKSWTETSKMRCIGEAPAGPGDAGVVDASAGDAGEADAGTGDAGEADAGADGSAGAPDETIEVPCVAPCEDDGDESCPANKFRPELILPDDDLTRYPEPDVVSNRSRGRNITEQMWIDYYAERGGVKSEVRLLNDAFAGVNSDFGTEFWAPKAEGATVIWAVVHDNRGGMTWVGMPVLIKKQPATTP
jgi:hypothetical protein